MTSQPFSILIPHIHAIRSLSNDNYERVANAHFRKLPFSRNMKQMLKFILIKSIHILLQCQDKQVIGRVGGNFGDIAQRKRQRVFDKLLERLHSQADWIEDVNK